MPTGVSVDLLEQVIPEDSYLYSNPPLFVDDYDPSEVEIDCAMCVRFLNSDQSPEAEMLSHWLTATCDDNIAA